MRSTLFDRLCGSLVAGTIGDAIAAPTEMMHYTTIRRLFGTVDGFMEYGETALIHPNLPAGTITDDTKLRNTLVNAIARKGGKITVDDWVDEWRDGFDPFDYYIVPASSYFRVIKDGVPPRQAGWGNTVSNGSAMCIAPVGLLNAGNSRQAVLDALEVTSVLHSGVGQDAAAAVAAAVAASFAPAATVDSVVAAATAWLPPRSAVRQPLCEMVDLARAAGSMERYTERFYESCLRPWAGPRPRGRRPAVPEGYDDTCDPIETVGAALGLFYLAAGQPATAVLGAANFGRDSDSIGAIVGGIAGAFAGAEAIPAEWIRLVEQVNGLDHRRLASGLLAAVLANLAELEAQVQAIRALV